jgi:hypothetical protein
MFKIYNFEPRFVQNECLVQIGYSLQGQASKARRDLETLLRSSGFRKFKKFPFYFKVMPAAEWVALSRELGDRIERLSRYAAFLELRVWVGGQLVCEVVPREQISFAVAA